MTPHSEARALDAQLGEATWLFGAPIPGPISSAPPPSAPPATSPPSIPPAPAGDDQRDITEHTARALMSVAAQLGGPETVEPWWMRAFVYKAGGAETTLAHEADITRWCRSKPEVRVMGCVGMLMKHRADILVVAAPAPRRGGLGPRVVLAARHTAGALMVMRGDIAPGGGWAWTVETGRRGEPMPMMVSIAALTTGRRRRRKRT